LSADQSALGHANQEARAARPCASRHLARVRVGVGVGVGARVRARARARARARVGARARVRGRDSLAPPAELLPVAPPL